MQKNFKIKINQRGSLLTEMMIGLLISSMTILLITVISFQFEKQKKITTAVSQSISNNVLTAFPLQTYGKNAGYGFNSPVFLGCTVRAHNSVTSQDFSYTLRPVFIEPNQNSNPLKDKITITLGSANNYYSSLKLTSALSSSEGPIPVNSRFGIRQGDVLLLAESGKDCTMMQTTELSDDVGRRHLVGVTGNTYVTNGLNKVATFNKEDFNGEIYNSAASVANFGRSAQKIEFSVNDNDEFVQDDTFLGTSQPVTLGKDVVAFKVIYALDTNNDGTVDSWTNVTPSVENTKQIIGFRYALISKASTVANDYAGSCSATTNPSFEWMGGTIDISDSSSNWKCYRYRVIQGTVPLKNMLWQSP